MISTTNPEATFMTPKLAFTLKSSIFDRARQLTIHPDYLEFEDKDLVALPPTRFPKEEIEGIRFGVKWIRGYSFYIGRIYCIDIRSETNQVIHLRLKSLYGIRKRELGDKYSKIANALFRYYFDDLARHYLRLFENNIPFDILGVNFSSEGVVFDEKAGLVSWDFLGTKSYYTYYTLFCETNPIQYKAYEYIHHWNVAVLESVTDLILKQKFPVPKS